MDELISRTRSARPNRPTRDQLCIRVQSDPGPNTAESKFPLLISRNILVFGVAKLPNLITLDVLAREIAHRLILILRTRFAQISKQLLDGIQRYARHAHDAAKGVSLDQRRDNLDS